MGPQLSVIICSLNGAAGVNRCLRALTAQTIRPALELIVVDDGSTDATSAAGRAHAAIVIRHPVNRGLAAARNTGLGAATAPVVAFLDDDCEPDPRWAEGLLANYAAEDVIGVGGPVEPAAHDGFLAGYLKRNNPLKPQEADLARSNSLFYRLCLYLGREWKEQGESAQRAVYSFAGANMSFRRDALTTVGLFDERFTFGGEDLDLCVRLSRAFPGGRLVFVPEARVVHHFRLSFRDTLRRSRAYGRGSARMYRKWPAVPPTLFPWPILILAMLLLTALLPALAMAALIAPQLMYPRGLRCAISHRCGASLLDGYLQLAQEACGNIGFLEGWWRFRHLIPEAAGTGTAGPARPHEQPELVP